MTKLKLDANDLRIAPLAGYIRVTVDGAVVRNCVRADEEAGVVYELPDLLPPLGQWKDGKPPLIEHRGVVAIDGLAPFSRQALEVLLAYQYTPREQWRAQLMGLFGPLFEK